MARRRGNHLRKQATRGSFLTICYDNVASLKARTASRCEFLATRTRWRGRQRDFPDRVAGHDRRVAMTSHRGGEVGWQSLTSSLLARPFPEVLFEEAEECVRVHHLDVQVGPGLAQACHGVDDLRRSGPYDPEEVEARDAGALPF